MSRNMKSSGEKSLNIKIKCKSEMGQDQVSRGINVLCWLAAHVAILMFYGNLKYFGNKVKVNNKVKFRNKVTRLCNVWPIEGVTVYGHVPECTIWEMNTSQ